MSLQSLSVFIAVAEEENFTSAARKLNLTQPTVSFHMDNLEKSLGCPLFNRTSKGVTLTPYGQRLYESARQVDDTLKTTYSEIKRMAAGAAGHIYLGASTIPGEYILPSLISSFLAGNPDIRFTLATGNSRSILEAFQGGQFAIAVVGIEPAYAEGVPLWDDEMILVAHPDMTARTGRAGLELLKTCPLILRAEPSGSRQTVIAALTKLGLQQEDLHIIWEVTGNQALKTAVLQQSGMGFISRWAVREELADGRLSEINLPGLDIQRTFYLVANPQLKTAAVQQFVEYLSAWRVKA